MNTKPRYTRRSLTLAALPAALIVTSALSAQSPILTDLELSLVTDVSGSVDSSEYLLQMQGYSSAFRNPSIHSAIQSGPNSSIAVNLIFFDNSAFVGLGWTLLTNGTDADAFADSIDALSRPGGGGTSPHTGINLATSELTNNIYDGTRLVIDVSGDGTGSSSLDAAARDAALAAGVDSINGLPILNDIPTLDEYYEDYIQGGSNSFTFPADSFEDFEDAVIAKLEAEILGRVPVSEEGDYLVSSTLRTVSISSARTVTSNVGGRLARLRSGVRSTGTETVTPAPYSAKGGMAKGGMAKEPIVTVERCPWEVWGQVYYNTEDLDQQFAPLAIPGANRRILLRPDTSIDTFGGTVGIDYDINDNWTIGFAVGAARSDVEMSLVGNTDIDTLSLMPYISYYQEVSPMMAFYADLLYAYGMTEYDTVRLPFGAVGNTDGDFHGLEFNTGLNMKSGSLVHGPFAQVRWLDGTIESYTETGPGAAFFPESDFESLATQLGYHVAYVMELSSGKLVPRFSAAWEHEFEADQPTVLGFPSATLDEDLAVLGTGIGYYVNCGWNISLDYEARLGSESQSHYVGVKAGVEF